MYVDAARVGEDHVSITFCSLEENPFSTELR